MLETSISEYLLKTPSADKWQRIGLQRRAGLLVPLFSVYSSKSLGVGDFSDLKLIIDWASITGQSILQLLPMNETGVNFCPYDSVSSFALEPLYLSLERLLPYPNNKYLIDKKESIAKLYPAGGVRVDYQIKQQKIILLRDIFSWDDSHNSPELKSFIEENAYWLQDFALFKVIKDCQGGKAWYEWEDKYKNRDKASLESFRREHEKEILFQIWIQWLAFKQLIDVKRYAEAKKVYVKGDLPMLVSRDSADVWAHPEFFKLEFAAGAPADMYCAKGQRWGMPLYNWENIASDGFRYLKEKLKFAQNFFDILRVDHVVGLFRIWSIPYHEPLENKGLNGFFDPKDEHKWEGHGGGLLIAMLDNTNMLLCAEDLGVIPKVCTDALKELGIPGNDVQRWVKDWKIKHDFLEPEKYRFLSVAMLSTHDTTNWPAWWENEAGTVDELLFVRKCNERGIDYGLMKERLFNLDLSNCGRLRWLNSIDSTDKLISILGRRHEEIKDFIDLYENSYQEKNRLWKHLKIEGPMREKCDTEIMKAAVKISLASSSIFCINTIIDWLYLTDIFKGDPYKYRINTPGTTSDNNWSFIIPIPLEDLLRHKVNKEIRALISFSGRL